MKILASAPGKLVLLGEYAVLQGAPAVVMAVNRRAKVLLSSSENSLWRFETVNFEAIAANFKLLANGSLKWLNSTERKHFRLVAKILSSLLSQKALAFSKLPAFTASMETLEFFQRSSTNKAKFGLGSSAALTVALSAALAKYSGVSVIKDKHEWLAKLLKAHRKGQQGVGSGADIAASLFGGVIEYKLHSNNLTPQVNALEMPEKLYSTCIFTGKSAITSKFVQAVESFKYENFKVFNSIMQELNAIAQKGVDSLKNSDLTTWFKVIDAYAEALDFLGKSCGIDICSDEHQRLVKLAANSGVHYKSCGAGGGDVGVAFSDDLERLEHFKVAISGNGFSALELQLDKNGMTTCEQQG